MVLINNVDYIASRIVILFLRAISLLVAVSSITAGFRASRKTGSAFRVDDSNWAQVLGFSVVDSLYSFVRQCLFLKLNLSIL